MAIANLSQQQRLDELLSRRDALRDNIARIKGRLDSAKADLATVEAECNKRNVPPDKLEDTIKQLNQKFETTVASLQKDIEAAETSVAPFLTEDA